MDNLVTDEELKKVMANFLDMGHVENITAMYRQDPRYYEWTGELLHDERFNVRLGVSVLFEDLITEENSQISRAIPSLAKLLKSEWDLLRGEAISVLAIINSKEAIEHIETMKNDPSIQVRELVEDILSEQSSDQKTL